jgi:protein SCO1/2
MLAELAKRYGVFYARQKVDTAGGGYVIDHTSETYVIDSTGMLKGKIPHAAPADEVTRTIRTYFSQN